MKHEKSCGAICYTPVSSTHLRQAALGRFKDGRIRVLVATDIAARGIDVSGLSHVFNYDLPNIPETYAVSYTHLDVYKRQG